MKAFVLNGDVDSNKLILQANIPFTYLKDNAVFSYMIDPTDDPYSDDKSKRNEYYQRRVDEKRVAEIKKFIKDSILSEKNGHSVAVLFPTAMLLATSANNDTPLKKGEIYELGDIIRPDEDMYIVDGQHRLFSMKSLYEDLQNLPYTEDNQYIIDYLKSFVFNCSVLLNYDMWEQAQIFADVNFNQKKVNSSLYYSIYGMHYSSNSSDLKRNYLFITHQLVKVLNTFELSPLKGFIKMLGTGNGYISQAFVADNLMKNIKSPRGIWYVDPEDVDCPPIYRYMTIELISFFSAIEKSFKKSWPVDGNVNSIICKTTGIGALLRLMVFIHKEMMPNKFSKVMRTFSSVVIYEEYESYIMEIMKCLKDVEDQLFSIEKGAYSGSGGKGLEIKLFHDMRDRIYSNYQRR